MASYKGKFTPVNKNKYMGDSKNIVYRSLLERRFMVWLDKNPNIIKWCSEELIIKYFSPVDNKWHRYFTDMYVEQKIGDCTKKFVVEVKPRSQTKQPKPPKTNHWKRKRRFFNETKTWIVNNAKWDSAKEFCKINGYEFIILTEKEIQNLQESI